MNKIIIGFFTCLLLILPTNSLLAIEEKVAVDVQQIFTSSKTIDGEKFNYPRGKAEMRLLRVEVGKGETIPLHSHPTPLLGHIECGQLTLKENSGKNETFKEGDSFILAANTPPHTMANSGNSSSIMWVTVASAEGIPTLDTEE